MPRQVENVAKNILTVRVIPETKRNLKIQAAKKDMMISDYLTYLVSKDIEEDNKTVKENN